MIEFFDDFLVFLHNLHLILASISTRCSEILIQMGLAVYIWTEYARNWVSEI